MAISLVKYSIPALTIDEGIEKAARRRILLANYFAFLLTIASTIMPFTEASHILNYARSSMNVKTIRQYLVSLYFRSWKHTLTNYLIFL